MRFSATEAARVRSRASSSLGPPEPAAGEPDVPDPTVFVAAEEMPVLIRMPRPVYPPIAREAGLAGTVVVHALVGRDGLVRYARIVRSIPALDESARAAVLEAVFRPAIQAQKPVAVWVSVPIRFRLE